MLKFLRKYNVLILVVGGSLLMVVFLLQPVLTRLAPSPTSRKIGTIGADNKKVTQGDLQEASDDLRVLENIAPFIAATLQLQPNDEMEHYYLLLHEADRAGVVGGVDDGVSWIPQLAADQARLEQLSQYPQQYWSLIVSQPFFAQAVSQRALQLEPQLMDRRQLLAQRFGIPIERVDQALANARGIYRYRASYASTLRFSGPDALELSHERFDAALADVLVVPASVFQAQVPAPTEDQLLAHYEAHKSDIPGTGEFGFGYLQPASVKLEWLVLDPASFSAAVSPDPIEVRKRWQQNREKYTREFAEERARIESEFRTERAEDLMVEAESIIRREVLAKTRQLETDSAGYLVLPEDWSSRLPRMADIARTIVTDLADAEGVTVPMPTVEIRESDWLNAQDIASIPTIGRAMYRVGATPVRAPAIPLFVHENNTGEQIPMHAQVGAPLVDPPAIDQTQRRYYITVLDARAESPPDSIDDVRDQVAADLTTRLAYDALLERAPNLDELAREQGLPAVAQALPSPPDGAAQPAVDTDVLLTRNGATPLGAAELADPRVGQATDFLDTAIDAAAQRLDPLAPIGASPLADSIVWDDAKSPPLLILARLKAYRPVTVEDFRARARGLLQSEARQMLTEATPEDAPNPFSFDALSKRANFILESRRDDDEPADEPTEETADASRD